jgi:hypothetical protein
MIFSPVLGVPNGYTRVPTGRDFSELRDSSYVVVRARTA